MDGGYVTFRLGEPQSTPRRCRPCARSSGSTGSRSCPAWRPPLVGVLELRGIPLPVVDGRPAPDDDAPAAGDVLVLERPSCRRGRRRRRPGRVGARRGRAAQAVPRPRRSGRCRSTSSTSCTARPARSSWSTCARSTPSSRPEARCSVVSAGPRPIAERRPHPRSQRGARSVGAEMYEIRRMSATLRRLCQRSPMAVRCPAGCGPASAIGVQAAPTIS